jgi:hypothetical protein
MKRGTLATARATSTTSTIRRRGLRTMLETTVTIRLEEVKR